MKYNMVAILSYCCCYCCSVTAACSNSTSPWTAKHQTPHSSNISQSFLKFMSTESVMLPNPLILCSLLSFLPSVFPSIKVFSNELALHIKWEKIRAPASASVFPMNIQGCFSLGLTGLIPLLSKGLSRVFSSATVLKHHFFGSQFLYGSSLASVHDYWKSYHVFSLLI